MRLLIISSGKSSSFLNMIQDVPIFIVRFASSNHFFSSAKRILSVDTLIRYNEL